MKTASRVLICIRQLCRVATVQFNSIRQSRLGKPPLTDLKHAGGEVNAAHAAFRTHGLGNLQQTVSRAEADFQDGLATWQCLTAPTPGRGVVSQRHRQRGRTSGSSGRSLPVPAPWIGVQVASCHRLKDYLASRAACARLCVQYAMHGALAHRILGRSQLPGK